MVKKIEIESPERLWRGLVLAFLLGTALFSFNSAMGAFETCRGFGRVVGVDLGLVIPDEKKTLRGGAPRIDVASVRDTWD